MDASLPRGRGPHLQAGQLQSELLPGEQQAPAVRTQILGQRS